MESLLTTATPVLQQSSRFSSEDVLHGSRLGASLFIPSLLGGLSWHLDDKTLIHHFKLHCSLLQTSDNIWVYFGEVNLIKKQHCVYHEFTLTGHRPSEVHSWEPFTSALRFCPCLLSESSKSSNVQSRDTSRLCALPPVMKTSTSFSLAPFWRPQRKEKEAGI